jgi:hypothetical protein
MRFDDLDRARRGASVFGPDIDHAAVACVLAHEDRVALLDCLDRSPGHDPWVLAVARSKVALARLAAAADLAADRVAIGTRLAISLGARAPETVVLAPWDEQPAPLGRIALRTRLGIAMLGMREGDHIDVPRHDGTIERLTIDGVLYQVGAVPAPAASPANDNRSGDKEVRS